VIYNYTDAKELSPSDAANLSVNREFLGILTEPKGTLLYLKEPANDMYPGPIFL
jgi:hypothetical protein